MLAKKIQISPLEENTYKVENGKLKTEKNEKLKTEKVRLELENKDVIIKQLVALQEEIEELNDEIKKKSLRENENTKDVLHKNETILNSFYNNKNKNELANKNNKKINNNQLKLKYNQEYLDSERRFLKKRITKI